MTFPFNLYVGAGVSGLLVAALSLPIWRWLSWRLEHLDAPGHRKIHHQRIPLAGGPAVLTGIVIPILAASLYLALRSDRSIAETSDHLLTYGLNRRAGQLLALLVGTVGMTLLGWVDDRYVLKPGRKFAGQFVLAALVALSGIRITLFVDNALFSFLITVLWILTVTNAFNIMDNMNGLCGGLGAIAAWFLAWSAAVQGQYLVATTAFLACGALLGFLPYNYPRASVFLGDSGSHLVGFMMAVLAILPHFHTGADQPELAVLKPLMILGVVLGDLVWVMILRWRLGQPIYVGDNNHLSHRLVRRGLSPERAVALIWLLAALLGASGFLW